MESNSVIHPDIVHGTLENPLIMDHTLVLLFSFFQVLSVGTGAPLEDFKLNVDNYVDTLIVRLTQNFQTPPSLTLGPPSAELGGLASIVAVLEDKNNLISDDFENVAQVKTELSSLVGYINQWILRHCSNQQTKPPVKQPAQNLQNRIRFAHSVSIEALMSVKEFLIQLRTNPDHLETC